MNLIGFLGLYLKTNLVPKPMKNCELFKQSQISKFTVKMHLCGLFLLAVNCNTIVKTVRKTNPLCVSTIICKLQFWDIPNFLRKTIGYLRPHSSFLDSKIQFYIQI